ncbi:MAG: S8 family serine peptidase [Pseudomonadota bacterium]
MDNYIVIRHGNDSFTEEKTFGSDPIFKDFRGNVSIDNLPAPKVSIEKGVSDNDIAEFNLDPAVYVHGPEMPIRLIEASTTASEKVSRDAWGIAEIGANKSQHDGAGVKVAVLDTGIEAHHPAFRGMRLIEEDYTDEGNGDTNGHGTHCAGTIFGRDIDQTRIGVAPGIDTALIGKILKKNGLGDSGMIFRGIEWALENNADVISMSVALDFPGTVKSMTKKGWPVDLATSHALTRYRANLRMFDAIMAKVRARAAFDEGSVLIAATGNQSRRDVAQHLKIDVALPGAADGVISVGALGRDNDGRLSVADFSNTAADVTAPGVAVKSAKTGGGLVDKDGTSMACPHVAGVAALWWQALRNEETDGKTTAQTVMAQLVATASRDMLKSPAHKADVGRGCVSAP